MGLIEQAKRIHDNPGANLNEIFKVLLRFWLKTQVEKHTPKRRGSLPGPGQVKGEGSDPNTNNASESESHKLYKDGVQFLKSRFIPLKTRYTVVQRSNRQCEYVSLTTGRRCRSERALEFHHVIPFAMGGKHVAHNILHYCKTHNLLTAERDFGLDKIEKDINQSRNKSINVAEPLKISKDKENQK